MMKNICVFTGTRADYGILKPLLYNLRESKLINLSILASGSHLSNAHGHTISEIEADGFEVSEKIEIIMDSHTPQATCTAMGLGLIQFSSALQRLKPDSLIVLGDRYEAFSVAAAALVSRIPIVHLHGGEVSHGSIDDSFRHAITKMANMHFTSTELARNNVVSMGEDPESVFWVGSLGVERILDIDNISRDDALERLKLPKDCRFFLITVHPETANNHDAIEQVKELIDAITKIPDAYFVFTGANADTNGLKINNYLKKYASDIHGRFRFFQSLGADLYIQVARHAEIILGNSSSGIIEIPSLGVASIDIGERQRGRERSKSVLRASFKKTAIYEKILEALSEDYQNKIKHFKNPYEKADCAKTMSLIIEKTNFKKTSQ